MNTFLNNLCAGRWVVLEFWILQRNGGLPHHNILPLLSIWATWTATEECVVQEANICSLSMQTGIFLLQVIPCNSQITVVSDPSQFWILILLLALFSRWKTEAQEVHDLPKYYRPPVPVQEMNWVPRAPEQVCHHWVIYFPCAPMLLVK